MAAKAPKHVVALSDALGRIMEYVAFELSKDGHEGVVLEPLGRFPMAAECCAWWLCDADENFYLRCVGALIPSFAAGVPATLLGELWKEEAARRDKSKDEMVVLETNSVAERYVIAAVRWLARPEPHRGAGFALLEDMVERAARGEDWNDAHFALAAIVKYGHPKSKHLLAKSRSFKGEGFLSMWAESLEAGKTEFLDQADELALRPPLTGFKLPAKHRKNLDSLLAAAEEFDKRERAGAG